MASKHKQRAKHGAPSLIELAKRSLDKGDFKQALRDAKVAFRQSASAESRQVLEQAHLGRARQLQRSGLQAEAQAVVQSLLDLGPTDPAVQRDLPELLVAVGLAGRNSRRVGVVVEEGDPLYVIAADYAVVRPEGAPEIPALRQGAGAVRSALAALEAGRDDEALGFLRDIPRTSPFADWKLLVRGLAAYYRGDSAEMEANWDRLDRNRFAVRIAAPLSQLAAGKVPGSGPLAVTIDRLEKAVSANPVLNRLQRLQELLLQEEWDQAIKLFRVSKPILAQAEPGLLQRVTQQICAALVAKGESDGVRALSKAADPLPIDPHWSHALALAAMQADDSVWVIERHMRAYAGDLAEVETLTEAERRLAQAIIWRRLGMVLANTAYEICPECGVCHEPDDEMARQAAACFESSIRLAPEFLGGYQDLAWAYTTWGEPDRAAEAYRRLLERFPDNLDALLFLGRHHTRRDEPLAAREYLLRARQLKPLDTDIQDLVYHLHLDLARHHALAKRWDEGRAAFAAAAAMANPRGDSSFALVNQAVFETKAGKPKEAQRLFDEARAAVGEASPVWLAAAAEAVRYALPKPLCNEYEGRWVTSLKRNRTSIAAGRMCRWMGHCCEKGIVYRGRNEHLEWLLDFLNRCSRTAWKADDLRAVLEFLLYLQTTVENEEDDDEEPVTAEEARRRKEAALPDDLPLLNKLATKGRKLFPNLPAFQYLAGKAEVLKGPARCDRRLARKCFLRVVELTEGAADPDSVALAKKAKEMIYFFDRVGWEHAPRRRGGRGAEDGFGPSINSMPAELREMILETCRRLGIDPQELFERFAGGLPLPLPPPSRR